jgi:hypothetical protein
MILLTLTQAAVESVPITGHRAAHAVSTFVRNALGFAQDNPLLLVALVVLALFVFRVTRPRVH